MSNKNSPAKGHHGMGARGQGKILFVHTQVAQAVAQSKNDLLRKRHHPQEFRRPDGHWAP